MQVDISPVFPMCNGDCLTSIMSQLMATQLYLGKYDGNNARKAALVEAMNQSLFDELWLKTPLS